MEIIKIEGGISVKTQEYDDKYEYAFYLRFKGERIDTRWYLPDNTCIFRLNRIGLYEIVCFFRKIGDINPTNIKSSFFYNEDNKEKENVFDFSSLSINIFGSCVSRDLLEYSKERNFKLGVYCCRSSVVSLVSKSLEYNHSINLDSNFQRKAVENDLNKTIWTNLEGSLSDYVIIDFIDERFELGFYKETYFTLSNEMVASKSINKSDYIVEKKEYHDGHYYIKDKLLDSYLDRFCDKLGFYYSDEKIIIHRALLLDYYRNRKGKVCKFSRNYLKWNAENRRMLHYMYDYIKYRFPKAIDIDICLDYLADENHKWGLAPQHYEKRYYLDVLNKISEAINKKR